MDLSPNKDLEKALLNLKRFSNELSSEERLQVICSLKEHLKGKIMPVMLEIDLHDIYERYDLASKIVYDIGIKDIIETISVSDVKKNKENRFLINEFCTSLKRINPPKIIKKKKSTLQLFQQANRSFQKSFKTLQDFVNKEPALSRENRLAIISGLFAPQWMKKTTYNEIRIALVRACWEKLCLYPQKNIAVRQAINDLSEFAFQAQKGNNFELLTKLGNVCRELALDEAILEPYQAQKLLRSSWGENKAISLVMAKAGKWQKMSRLKKSKNGFIHHLLNNRRVEK